MLIGLAIGLGPALADNSAARVLTDLCYAWESKMNGLNDATIGEDVIVRESPGKGKGVFALRALSAEVRGRYTGNLWSKSEHDRLCADGSASYEYAASLGARWVLDAGTNSRGGWAHMVNHSRRKANVQACVSNLPGWTSDCSFMPTAPVVLWVEATRDIAAGEELMSDYGNAYWDARVCKGLHEALPMLSPLWRLHPCRLAIDYF